jgi:hypothetical protein
MKNLHITINNDFTLAENKTSSYLLDEKDEMVNTLKQSKHL